MRFVFFGGRLVVVLADSPGVAALFIVLFGCWLRRVGDARRRRRGRDTLRASGLRLVGVCFYLTYLVMIGLILLGLAYDGLSGYLPGGFWARVPQQETVPYLRGLLALVAGLLFGATVLALLSRVVIDARGVECLPRWSFGRRRSFAWRDVVSWQVEFREADPQLPLSLLGRTRTLVVRLADVGPPARFGPNDCCGRQDELIDAFRKYVPGRLVDSHCRLPADAADRLPRAPDNEGIIEGPSDHIR